MRAQVLAAFGAWLKLDPELGGMSDEALVSHPLVLALLSALEGQEHLECAVDGVVELIYCSSIMMNHSTAPGRYMPLVQLLVGRVRALLCWQHCPRIRCHILCRIIAACDGHVLGCPSNSSRMSQVLQLQPRFALVAQQLQLDHSTSELSDDEDTAKGMARLFAEVGEAFTEIIAAGGKQRTGWCTGGVLPDAGSRAMSKRRPVPQGHLRVLRL